MKVKVFNAQGDLVGPLEVPPVVKSDEEWRKQLTAEQFIAGFLCSIEFPLGGEAVSKSLSGDDCTSCRLVLGLGQQVPNATTTGTSKQPQLTFAGFSLEEIQYSS